MPFFDVQRSIIYILCYVIQTVLELEKQNKRISLLNLREY